MKQTIYIFSNGELKRKDNTLYFETEKGKKYVPVENTGEILVFGEVSFNKRLLEFLTKQEIILHFFNHYGYYVGSYYPREHLNSGYMILKQAEHYLDPIKRSILARKFVTGSVANMKKVITYYINRGKDINDILIKINILESQLPYLSDIDKFMAIEGNIKNYYYETFVNILNNPDFPFEVRTKRPPKNMLNALISFGNSLLYTTALSEIYKTHLDPRIGFLHSANFRKFSLNLDIAEIFKPVIVDRVVFTLINKGIIKINHFESKLEGIVLNDKGREMFIKEYEEKLKTTFCHKKLKRNVSYKTLIRLETYKIQKHLMEELEYTPYVSNW